MMHVEALRASVNALRANKFRSFLTGLGLVIGNASVIWVVTISLTSRDYVLDQVQRVGSNLIYASYESGNNPTMATADADYIKSADVEAVRAKLGSRVVAVTGVMNNSDRMRVAGREEDVQIIGTDYYYPAVRNIALLSGRFVEEHEVAGRAKVAMLTERLATRLYGGLPQAVGQTIKLHDLQFSVIGTFKEKADTFGNTELGTETVLIPITVLRYFARIERIDPLYVQARTPDDVEGITREVRTVLEARHRTGAHYRVDNLGAILETAKSIATILTGVLLAVSAIALVISGIGIMNIMLVTVTERTREIGLRLAVGASKRDVMEQFLMEAVIISVGGGAIGILVGVALPASVRYFTDDIQVPISMSSIAIAFGVSLLVGLVFGILPANRASRLNPTEALRYE